MALVIKFKISVRLCPDQAVEYLSVFSYLNAASNNGIVPCGISESLTTPFGVTSLAKLGQMVTMPELDMALQAAFADVFGD
mgnify:CR=1 FL=1